MTILIHIISDIYRTLAHDLFQYGLTQACHFHRVVDPHHPNVLIKAVCFIREIPGYAHPAVGR